MNNSERIIEIARSYVGQKEIRGNQGFISKTFERAMRDVGFYTGASWCAYFVKLVWKEAGQDVKLISGSTMKTMVAAAKAGNWHAHPIPGSIVIYRSFKNGKSLDSGHAGIVTKVGDMNFSTIEGNTTDKGGREGEIVAERYMKPYNWTENNGLRLMGFIWPK